MIRELTQPMSKKDIKRIKDALNNKSDRQMHDLITACTLSFGTTYSRAEEIAAYILENGYEG